MRKPLLILAALFVVAASVSTWFLVRGSRLQVEWCPDWPHAVRGIGEASEKILRPPEGKATESDRARAAERARWKAYYYAQLRLAEQVGKLRIDASTSIRDMNLTDQELAAHYSGTIHAAREVEREGRVETKGDVVQARIVVEAPSERVLSLRQALVSALRSGRVAVTLPGRTTGSTSAAVAAPASQETQDGPARLSHRAPARAAGPPHPQPSGLAPLAERAAQPARPSGCVIVLEKGASFLAVTPSFRDAGGAALGTALDLPADRLVAGLPLASPGDSRLVEELAGKVPLRLHAAVVEGDVVLTETLSHEARAIFSSCLTSGRIVLALPEEPA